MRYFGVLAGLALGIGGCAGIHAPAGSGDAGTGGGAGTGTGGFSGGSGGSGQGTDATVFRPLAGMVNSDSGSKVTVSGKPAEVHFTVKLDDGSQPKVNWTVDDTLIGSVGSDGVFHANGYVGGVVTVTATVGNAKATTQITVVVDIVEPGSLNEGDTTTIKTGGTSDAEFKWLYPYDKTVFPRGLEAPVMQFGGNGTRATFTKITTTNFSWQSIANVNDPTRVIIPPQIWKGLTLTAGPKDPVTVAVTKLAGNTATGPVTRTWFVAPASINGIIYYSTYKGSMLANGQGGIMRIPAGKNAELVVSAGGNLPTDPNKGAVCTACHSVSANGSVLAAGSQNAANAMGDWNPVTSQTYNLTDTGTAGLRKQSMDGQLFSFVGLTPDGAMGLVSGLPPKRNWPFLPHGVASTPGTPSKMVDTTSGADVAAPSLTALVQYATTPAFSPDGAHVAFVNSDKLGAMCTDMSCTGACLDTCPRVLSVMDYDGKASPPAFSNLRDLVSDTGTGKAVAWPTFLPDGKGVIYQQGDSLDSNVFLGDFAPAGPQFGELRLVELQDKTVKTLDAVNGRTGGTLYLPYGEMAEGRMNYEASVLPVAVGGYYWVLFTSRRTYGNTISPTSGDPPGNDAFGSPANPSPRKKIWIAAIDIDHAGKADPSHPAMYLPGQELHTANMRGFAALAPCKPNMGSCESGADCCGGFCRETSRSAEGVPTLQCVPPPVNTCSNTLEPCTSAADCCNPLDACINKRCAQLIP